MNGTGFTVIDMNQLDMVHINQSRYDLDDINIFYVNFGKDQYFALNLYNKLTAITILMSRMPDFFG